MQDPTPDTIPYHGQQQLASGGMDELPNPLSQRAEASGGGGAGLRARRSRRACTECRQAKLRCDAVNLPCSRCRRLRVPCKIDGNYKRVDKNRKITDLEAEVQRLRTAATLRTSSALTPYNDSEISHPMNSSDQLSPSALNSGSQIVQEFSLTRDGEYLSDLATASIVQPDISSPGIANSSRSLPIGEQTRQESTTSRSIGNVRLSGDDIDVLFKIYFEHYHAYLPILDASLRPEEYYNNSALLFWTIIVIATRRYQDDVSLLTTLGGSVSNLTWKSISSRPHHHLSVAAIVLQITWPFPTSSPANDNSYILSGVALQAAVQMGLHRPEDIQDFSRTKARLTSHEIADRTRIWACCNIIAQHTAMGLGHQQLMPFDWSVDRCCGASNNYKLLDNLRHHLIIQRFCYRVGSVMSGSSSEYSGPHCDGARLLMLSMLERDINDLTEQLHDEMTVINQIYLAGARLNLFVFYFFECPDTAGRKEGLLKAVAAASEYIQKVIAADAETSLLTYAPIFLYHGLSLSAFLLLKIFGSSYTEYIDCETGRKTFNSAVIGLRHASVANNDLPAKASQILLQLWQMVDNPNLKKTQEPELRLRSRFGNSVVHDCAWRWREEFGGQANAYPTPSDPAIDTSMFNTNEVTSGIDGMDWLWGLESLMLPSNS